MTHFRKPGAVPWDAQAIQHTIERALASAGLDTASGPLSQVTQTIRQALAAGGLPAQWPEPAAPRASGPGPNVARNRAGSPQVIDVAAREVFGADADADADAEVDVEAGAKAEAAFLGQPRPAACRPHTPAGDERRQINHPAGQLAYHLHVPAASTPEPRPLLLMLHGCTQGADDFARGTAMNRLADAHGVLVAYPEQAAHANASRCWNWFRPQDQGRGAGEPALLAAVVRDVVERHPVHAGRIYVAGLSAGAAMAVVLGQAYPELFAGVGVHSGLPYGSAHDTASALAKMKGGRSGLPGLRGRATPAAAIARAVPTIVFHGDRDHLVQACNGDEVVHQCLAAYQAQPAAAALKRRTEQGVSPGGRRYTRTVHADAQGQALVEEWTVHGAGHAWSGGSPQGSFTDAAGPDASAAMLRFFLALQAPPPGAGH